MRIKARIRIVPVLLTAAILAGCSSIKFIANGKEFQKICEDNGLQVQEASASVPGGSGYKSLTDAYLAVSSDGSCSVWYIRFSDIKDAESYYKSLADQMDGTEYSGSNYKAEIESTDNGKSRDIYMESGRIIYADGDTSAISTLENQLIGSWNDEEQGSGG